jgi:hypothetical protein
MTDTPGFVVAAEATRMLDDVRRDTLYRWRAMVVPETEVARRP